MASKPNVVQQYPLWLSSSKRATAKRSRNESLKLMQTSSTRGTRKKKAKSLKSETSQMGTVSTEACVCRLCLEAIEEPKRQQ